MGSHCAFDVAGQSVDTASISRDNKRIALPLTFARIASNTPRLCGYPFAFLDGSIVNEQYTERPPDRLHYVQRRKIFDEDVARFPAAR